MRRWSIRMWGCIVVVTVAFAATLAIMFVSSTTLESSKAVGAVGSIENMPSAKTERPHRTSNVPAVDGSEPWVVRGIVQNGQRAKLARASVCWMRTVADCCSPSICTETDLHGRFSASGKGLRPVLLSASAAGYASVRRPVPDSGSHDAIVITLTDPSQSAIFGRVVDATGGYVAGALISAQTSTDPTHVMNATSDAHGSFRLESPEGSIRVMAHADGYSSSVQMVNAPARGLTFMLAPSSAIKGRVLVDGTEAPVAGVRVVASGAGGLYLPPTSTLTDVDGVFELRSLQAGEYVLAAMAEDWRAEPTTVRVGLGQELDDVILDATRAGSLRGTLRVRGETCTNGQVVLDGPTFLPSTASLDGSIAIDGIPPGSYDVSISCSDALPQVEQLQLGIATVHRHWDLNVGLKIVGTTLRADGRPLPNARVRVESFSEPLDQELPASAASRSSLAAATECSSDASGEFACGGLVPGNYRCSVVSTGQQEHRAHVSVSLLPGSDSRVILRAAAQGKIRATVAGLRDSHHGLMVYAASEALTGPIEAVRQGDAFVLERLALGDYRVYVGPFGDTAETAVLARLERDGQVLDMELSRPRSGSIAGRALDARGEPVVDAWVHLSVPPGLVRGSPTVQEPVLTDGQGNFAFHSVLKGLYDVRGTAPSGEAITRGAQSGNRNVVLRFEDYATLSGTVDARGAPAARFRLTYSDEDGHGAGLSGVQGRWSLPRLVPGRYRLEAVAVPDGRIATREVTLAPGAHVELSLSLEERSERGAGTAASTHPMSDVNDGPAVVGIANADSASGPTRNAP